MKQYTKLEHLNKFAELLLNNGFTLIVRDEPLDRLSTYFHFWKDGNLGYVQSDKYECTTFSTVHKPCKEYGTGFRASEEWAELTIENANKALVRVPAPWAGERKTRDIKYYSSPSEYVEKSVVLKYKIIEPKNA